MRFVACCGVCCGVCCSVLQCVTVCYSVLQCVYNASWCVLQLVAVCVSVCVAVCVAVCEGCPLIELWHICPYRVAEPRKMSDLCLLQCDAVYCRVWLCAAVRCNKLQWRRPTGCRILVCSSVEECVAECCRVLQSVAECCRVLQSVSVAKTHTIFDLGGHSSQCVCVCVCVCVRVRVRMRVRVSVWERKSVVGDYPQISHYSFIALFMNGG